MTGQLASPSAIGNTISTRCHFALGGAVKSDHWLCCGLFPLCCAGICYFGVSILGFFAFGTAVSENVLLAFENGPQHWVVAMANMMVVIHVAAAYQVGAVVAKAFAQDCFAPRSHRSAMFDPLYPVHAAVGASGGSHLMMSCHFS